MALFDDGGGRDLYLPNRVGLALASPVYQQDRERHLAIVAKSRATRERNRQKERENRAAEREAFGGEVYIATFEYKHHWEKFCNNGWEKSGVLAKDEASAIKLFNIEGKEIEKEHLAGQWMIIRKT